MRQIVSVNPFRCRVWSEHERLTENITEDTCTEEIRSFERHGQQAPALGRAVRGDPTHDIEVICGARRLFVAQHLNVELLIEIRAMSDRDAIVALDLENRQRKDLSPYERGTSYQNWMRKGYFSSQDDIALTLGISASQVSRLIKLALLPSVVVAAFNGGIEIRETWGVVLHKMWHDPSRRGLLADTARTLVLEQPGLSAQAVYEKLLAAGGKNVGRRRASGDEVVRADAGNALFKVRYRGNSIMLLLSRREVPRAKVEEIKAAVAGLLQDAKTLQVPIPSVDFSRACLPAITPAGNQSLQTML